jgi:predicted nucleic acid-binding protein
MISYFDTSVLYASLVGSHELHEKALKTLETALSHGPVVTTTLHTYAELYTNLTRPNKYIAHISPEQAAEILLEGINKVLTIVELNQSDYEAAVIRCRELKLVSAVIYDALHYQAALKAGAEVIYADNLKDFTRLQLPGETIEIKGIR